MSNRLPTLAAEIRKAHADVQEAARTAAERAIDAGNALIEAKSLCGHGKWIPWLRENCAISDRTARLYMQIARSGMKSATVADIGIKAAAKALAKPRPATPSRFICLPAQRHMGRLGIRSHDGGIDVLFVRECLVHKGFYSPLFTKLPWRGDAETDWLKRPIRAEAVATAFEVMAPDAWADVFSIEWYDVPRDHLDVMADEMVAFFQGEETELASWRGEVRQ